MAEKTTVNINDLPEEALPVQEGTLDDLPMFGQGAPPQPGIGYRFRLPASERLANQFEPLLATWLKHTTNQNRVSLVLDSAAPLVIVASPTGKHDGEPFETRLSNAEMERGRKGSGAFASDLDYLLRSQGETTRPASNKAYAETIVKHGGKEFTADIVWSWACNKERDLYGMVDGKRAPIPGMKGCGERYKQADKTNDPAKAIQKVPGQNGSPAEYPREVQCRCGGLVRAFANLDNIRA